MLLSRTSQTEYVASDHSLISVHANKFGECTLKGPRSFQNIHEDLIQKDFHIDISGDPDT